MNAEKWLDAAMATKGIVGGSPKACGSVRFHVRRKKPPGSETTIKKTSAALCA